MITESQLGEIWLLFRDYIDDKKLDHAAERYVDLLGEMGVSKKSLESTDTVDPTLYKAVEFYLQDDEAEDDDKGELKF